MQKLENDYAKLITVMGSILIILFAIVCALLITLAKGMKDKAMRTCILDGYNTNYCEVMLK